MSTRAQSKFLRVFSGSTDYQLWQSFYTNQNIALGGKTYAYFPFQAGGVQESSAASGDQLIISVPATELAISTFEAAIRDRHIFELSVFEFDSRLDQVAPQSAQVLIGSYFGEIIEMNGTFTRLEASIGSALSFIGSQVPPRTFTSKLVGAPIRI